MTKRKRKEEVKNIEISELGNIATDGKQKGMKEMTMKINRKKIDFR